MQAVILRNIFFLSVSRLIVVGSNKFLYKFSTDFDVFALTEASERRERGEIAASYVLFGSKQHRTDFPPGVCVSVVYTHIFICPLPDRPDMLKEGYQFRFLTPDNL